MRIQIDLPVSSIIGGVDDSYENAAHHLKQMELAVHHAQKSLEQMGKLEGTNPEKPYSVNIRVRSVEIYNEELDEGNPERAFIEIESE